MTISGTHRTGRLGFPLGLAIGLVAGVVIGLAAAFGILAFKASRAWVDAGAVWVRLPSQAEAGPLPQTFAIPARAYDYGATTRPLEPTVTDGVTLIRVTLGAVQGRVGVSLDRPDGSALISKEQAVTTKDNGQTLYFRVTGREGQVSLLVRNYDAEGTPGSIAVTSVAYRPEAGIPAADLSKINAAGVNGPRAN